MATALSPLGTRSVVRCDLCLLTQFMTSNHNCRRCGRSLDATPEPPPAPAPVPAPSLPTGSPSMQLPCTVKTLRIRLRLSQRQLASRMSVPRTYVSKIENSKALPALPSLERLALALEVSVGELLNGAERVRRDETAELAGDKFVAELMPFFGKLTQEQMATVLIEVQALARRRVALGGLPCVARVVSLVGARGTTGHISAIS